MTFTTAAFDRSSSRLFEALSYKTAPRGPPSSLVQHDAFASLDTTSHTTVHAGPHTAVRRVELSVNSQAFCIVPRQETIRSLPGRPSGLPPYLPPEGQTILVFCRVSSRRSHCLLVLPFTPLAEYRSGLRSSFPAWPILFAPPFGIGVPHYPRRLHNLLCPLLTSTARSG